MGISVSALGTANSLRKKDMIEIFRNHCANDIQDRSTGLGGFHIEILPPLKQGKVST